MLSTTKCWQVMSTKSFGMSLWHVSKHVRHEKFKVFDTVTLGGQPKNWQL